MKNLFVCGLILFFSACNLFRMRNPGADFGDQEGVLRVKGIKILNKDADIDDRHPVFSPDGSKIAFESDRDGSIDIWIMDSEGTNLRQLTRDPGVDEDPSFSPDGKEIVFSSEQESKYSNIWIMDIEGENKRRLTRYSANFAPKFSPDGKEIAFISYRSDELAVWVMGKDGGNPRQFTVGGTGDWGPDWSPDGKKIVFASRRHGKYEAGAFRHPSFHINKGDVWLINTAGEEREYRQLTLDRERDMLPAFSPDGKWIAFFSERGGSPDVWIMKADGTGQRQLTRKISGKWKPQYDFRYDFYRGMAYFYLSWSPDGTKLAFTRVGKKGKGDLGIITLDVPPLPVNNLINVDLKNYKKRALRLEEGAKSSNRPEAGIDLQGNAIAVFEKFDGKKNRIYALRSRVDSLWSEAEIIDNGKGNAYRPILYLHPSGKAFVVFPQQEGDFLRLYAAQYSPESGWKEPVIIDPGPGIADGSRLVMDKAGNTFVVFEYFDGRGSRIFINQYSPGKGWGAAQNIDQRTGNAYYPQIVLLDNNPLVAFVQERLEEWAVIVRQYRPELQGWDDGVRIDAGLKSTSPPPANYTHPLYAHQFKKEHWWQSPSKVDRRNRYSDIPRIALGPAGRIFVVFRKWDGKYFRIAANIYEKNKGWGRAGFIDRGRRNAEHPSIVVNSQGRAVVVFTQKEGKKKGDFLRVYSREYSPEQGWGDLRIIDQGDGDAYGPRLALGGDNQVVAVWCQWKNNLVRSFISYYNFSRGWFSPVITNPEEHSTCGTTVAANLRGEVVTIFEQEEREGGNNRIYGGRYLLKGVRLPAL